jgi:hypothetical protein
MLVLVLAKGKEDCCETYVMNASEISGVASREYAPQRLLVVFRRLANQSVSQSSVELSTSTN